MPRRPSNWRSQIALPDWLEARGVVAIANVDTRKLTRLLRDRGAQNGAVHSEKARVLPVAHDLLERGFSLVATAGTARVLHENGLPCEQINKVMEGSPIDREALRDVRPATHGQKRAPMSQCVRRSVRGDPRRAAKRRADHERLRAGRNDDAGAPWAERRRW